MSTNYTILNKRYFLLGAIIYVIATYIGLKFDTYLFKDNLNIYIYSLYYIIGLTTVSCILYFLLHKNSQILNIYLIVLIFVIGFVRVYSVCSYYNKNNKIINENPNVCGIVTSEPKLSSSGQSYVVDTDILYLNTNDETIALDKPIRTVTYISKDSVKSPPSFGDTFNCTYRYELNMKPSFKGAFDYSRYLKQNKICYSGYTYNYNETDIPDYKPSPFRRLCNLGYKLRFAVKDSVKNHIYNENEAALLCGILLGDVSGFSDKLYESYTDSGLIHVASVSGMHTSYIFLIISIILTLMRVPKRLFALFAIPVLLIFAAVALFTPSVNRAVIMLSIMLLSYVFKRQHDSLTALAFSAVVIIFNNPYCLESYSFILSFSATLGLLICADPIQKMLSFAILSPKNKLLNKPVTYLSSYVVNSVSLSLSGLIGISYFTAKFFGRIAFGGIIGNILIYPAVALILIFGFINSFVFRICKPLSDIIAVFVLNPTLKFTNCIAEFFSKDIFSVITLRPNAVFFIFYIVICYIVYILLIPSKTDNEK